MKACPVCHGHLDEKDAAANKRMVYYFGRFYYLMCPDCKAAFMQNPDGYAGGEKRGPAPATRECGRRTGADSPAIRP